MHPGQAIGGPDLFGRAPDLAGDPKALSSPGKCFGEVAGARQAQGEPGAARDCGEQAAAPEVLVDGRVDGRVGEGARDPADALDGPAQVPLPVVDAAEADARPDLEIQVADRGGDGEPPQLRLYFACDIALGPKQIR